MRCLTKFHLRTIIIYVKHTFKAYGFSDRSIRWNCIDSLFIQVENMCLRKRQKPSFTPNMYWHRGWSIELKSQAWNAISHLTKVTLLLFHPQTYWIFDENTSKKNCPSISKVAPNQCRYLCECSNTTKAIRIYNFVGQFNQADITSLEKCVCDTLNLTTNQQMKTPGKRSFPKGEFSASDRQHFLSHHSVFADDAITQWNMSRFSNEKRLFHSRLTASHFTLMHCIPRQ